MATMCKKRYGTSPAEIFALADIGTNLGLTVGKHQTFIAQGLKKKLFVSCNGQKKIG